VTALLRMVYNVSGGDGDVTDFIGNHECADVTQSLFDDQSQTKATSSKSSLLKALPTDTQIYPALMIITSVILDAMSDTEDYLLLVYTKRNQNLHFCCDRYYPNSLKSAERNRRVKLTEGKVYDVSDQFRAPDPKTFFNVSENKVALLEYLCEKMIMDVEINQQLGVPKLFLAGGFQDATRSILLTKGSSSPVPDLQ
jgi:hypothetical protein